MRVLSVLLNYTSNCLQIPCYYAQVQISGRKDVNNCITSAADSRRYLYAVSGFEAVERGYFDEARFDFFFAKRPV